MAIKKERLFLIVVLTAVLLFFLFHKGILPGITSKLSPYKSFKLLGTVIGLVKSEYIVEVNPEKTMKGALKGLIDSLDVLSSYLDKARATKYLELKKADFMDIGIILSKRHSSFPVVVIGVIENSPAEKIGIKIGDIISRLDGQSTLMMSLIEAKLHLKDKEKKPVKLKILRDNDTPELNVERKLLFDKPYSFSQLEGTNGILKIHHLYSPCVRMIKKKILPVLKSKKKALILDLRNCHEGDFEEALKLIKLFLKANKIGYFERHNGVKEMLSVNEYAVLEKMPLAIWTNQATIGPAEAVAAVLQEMRQAKIIGVPTPGLVAAQKLFSLEDGSALLLTTGIFHLKSGRKLWGKGIKPDVKIEIKDQKYESFLKSTQDILPRMTLRKRKAP